jgi:hypothetical protein
MTASFHTGFVCAFCACVAGCAATGTTSVTGTAATLMRAKTITARDARDAIVIGKSTKSDVLAALGNTVVIRFDSGFEIWVYQYSGDTTAKANGVERIEYAGSGNGTLGKTEFVVLFAPSGVVTKTRIRPAPLPSGAKGT